MTKEQKEKRRLELVIQHSHLITSLGYANDLPDSFLPAHLRWNVWFKKQIRKQK